MPIKAAQWNPANPSSSPYNADASTFNLGQTGNVRFAVWNASPNDILISWGSGSAQQDLIPAWLARLFCVNIGQSQLQWVIDSTLDTSATPPASLIKVFTYQPSETITDSFPIPIQHQVSLGAGVNILSADNVTNTNQPPFTSIVYGLPSGDSTALGALNIENSGFIQQGDSHYQGQTTYSGPSGHTTTITNDNLETPQMTVDNGLTVSAGGILLSAGALDIEGDVTVHNGSVNGTVTMYVPVWGGSLKIIMVVFNAYQSGASFTFNLPGSMNFGAVLGGNFGAESVTPQLNGVNSTGSVITALASTGGTLTGVTAFDKGIIGELAGTTNQLLIASNAAQVSRMLLIIGV